MILVVALLVLGPERLPEAARQAGRALAEMRRMSSGFQAEIRDAMQTPAAGPAMPPSPSEPGSSEPGSSEPGQKYLWSDLPTPGGAPDAPES